MSMSPELQQDIADVEAGTERVMRPGRWRVERKNGKVSVEMLNTGREPQRHDQMIPEEREDRERQLTRAPTPGPLSGDEYRCPDCGAQADERFDCCKAPTAPVKTLGETLHPATADLVDRFAAELKSKLAKAEAKYGYRDDWSKPDWKDDLIESLAEHVQKGDPRDVAAYFAFAWHHGWSTSDAADHLTGPFSPPSENGQPAWADQDIEDLLSDAIGDSFDMDWSARDGAKAVLAALKREGLLGATKHSEAPTGLTPAEQKTQAARCGCQGSDDMCPCQNSPDRQTIKDRSDA